MSDEVKLKPETVPGAAPPPAQVSANRTRIDGWRDAISLLLICVDLCAVTWYLWQLPADHFDRLSKILTSVGSWIASVLTYLGLRNEARKREFLSRLARGPARETLLVLLTVMVWFFILPFHSVSVRIADADDRTPLDATWAVGAGENARKPITRGASGVMIVHGLLAAPITITVGQETYASQELQLKPADILRFGTPGEIFLKRKSASILFNSVPQGASVYLDRKTIAVGITPITLSLALGSHLVRFDLSRHKGADWEEINVMESANEPFSRVLQPLPPQIQKLYDFEVIVTEDSVVTLAGQRFAAGIRNIRLAAGTYSLNLIQQGCKPFLQTVHIPEEKGFNGRRAVECAQ